jgi:hypothetical protein
MSQGTVPQADHSAQKSVSPRSSNERTLRALQLLGVVFALAGGAIGVNDGYALGQEWGEPFLRTLVCILGLFAGGLVPALVVRLTNGPVRDNPIRREWVIGLIVNLAAFLGGALAWAVWQHGTWLDEGTLTAVEGVCGSVLCGVAGAYFGLCLPFLPVFLWEVVRNGD